MDVFGFMKGLSIRLCFGLKLKNYTLRDFAYYYYFRTKNLINFFREYVYKKIGTKHRVTLVTPDKDLILENSYGLFKVRKNTTDYITISELWESDLKPFFEMITNGVFIDVGAHIGKWTIFVAKRLPKKGKVIAIEMDEGNYKALVRNIKLNKLENVTTLNVAASNAESEVKVMSFPHRTSWSHILINAEEKGENVKMTIQKHLQHLQEFPQEDAKNGIAVKRARALPLDTIIKAEKINVDTIKLLKVDVEGHELNVFRGAQELLRTSNHLNIIFETFPQNRIPTCKFLKQFGFKVYHISGDNYFARKE